MVGTCMLLMLATGDWPTLAITPSAMGTVLVIKATPSGLAGKKIEQLPCFVRLCLACFVLAFSSFISLQASQALHFSSHYVIGVVHGRKNELNMRKESTIKEVRCWQKVQFKLHQTLPVLCWSFRHSVIQPLLRMLSFIAQHTVLCVEGGAFEADQNSCTTCQRYFAPPQPMYALWPVYALPLKRVKCDTTDALRRTVVSSLMV